MKTPWHKRFHSDALNGYMSLTLEERGAYTTILDMMYDRGGPIQDNERLVAGYMGVSLRKYKSVKAALIDKGKIQIIDGHIVNDRCVLEIEKLTKTSRKRAESGAKGGAKRPENTKKANEINETPKQLLSKPVAILEARNQKLDIKENIKRKKPRNGGTRIAEDWKPTAKDLDFAKSKFLDKEQIEFQCGSFHNHWLASSSDTAWKKDWAAAWRTWILHAIKYGLKPANQPRTMNQIAG
jgi:uncharacterized protein YdaU (DUF1376 family)